MSNRPGPENGEPFRAGFVALVGLPNVGKSTLLNRLVGERLSAVTPKAQTTRRRLRGIYSDGGHQAVFVDTPGLLEPRYLLQRAMQEEVGGAVEDADVVVYVADAGYPRSLQAAAEFRAPARAAALLCLNKVDRVSLREAERLADSLGEGWSEVVATVATGGKGTETLRRRILDHLPPSPPYYPLDDLSTASVRYIAGEFVRETCFEKLEQEVPYSIEVAVQEFKERPDGKPTYILAYVYVERKSQKGIVIGREGQMIREIGRAARRKIEAFLDRAVYLELRVKVLPNWRKRAKYLKMLGYRHLPEER